MLNIFNLNLFSLPITIISAIFLFFLLWPNFVYNDRVIQNGILKEVEKINKLYFHTYNSLYLTTILSISVLLHQICMLIIHSISKYKVVLEIKEKIDDKKRIILTYSNLYNNTNNLYNNNLYNGNLYNNNLYNNTNNNLYNNTNNNLYNNTNNNLYNNTNILCNILFIYFKYFIFFLHYIMLSLNFIVLVIYWSLYFSNKDLICGDPDTRIDIDIFTDICLHLIPFIYSCIIEMVIIVNKKKYCKNTYNTDNTDNTHNLYNGNSIICKISYIDYIENNNICNNNICNNTICNNNLYNTIYITNNTDYICNTYTHHIIHNKVRLGIYYYMTYIFIMFLFCEQELNEYPYGFMDRLHGIGRGYLVGAFMVGTSIVADIIAYIFMRIGK
ncbi:integral membrane [Ecytonucleospora hepatopenaei]|uniref:Integral membrane n=1 Tax=Ecytonucleospora hepatopenaei TaxID=646526 RepID=A0A1W0E3K8_9MICR|nr:integral membrane [Ecytonucleospora hepatopenaei]